MWHRPTGPCVDFYKKTAGSWVALKRLTQALDNRASKIGGEVS